MAQLSDSEIRALISDNTYTVTYTDYNKLERIHRETANYISKIYNLSVGDAVIYNQPTQNKIEYIIQSFEVVGDLNKLGGIKVLLNLKSNILQRSKCWINDITKIQHDEKQN
jgi:hypothetical protein